MIFLLKNLRLLLLIAFMVGVSWCTGSGTACASTRVNLYYQPLNLEIPPVESADPQQPPLLPLRQIAGAMGADLSWDEYRGMIQLQKEHTTLKFRPGDATGIINFEEIPLPEVRVINGYTMASFDFFQLALGEYFDIKWDPSQQLVDITYKYVAPVSLSLSYGLYNGPAINGIPQGQGTLVYPNGSSYKGYFRNGYPTLYGTVYSTQGEEVTIQPVSKSVANKGPNAPNKVVAGENSDLFYCDPSPAGSGQIYKLSSNGNMRFCPEIANCIDAADGWLYYVNQSESGRLYRVAVNGKNRQRLTDFPVCELLAIKGRVFLTRQVSPDKYALYRINPDTQQLTLILEAKEALHSLQIYNNKLYFSCTKDILCCDLDGSYITAIAAFQNPISDVRIQDGWVYYLQKGWVNRLRLDATDWSKVIDMGSDGARNLWVDKNYIYAAVLSQDSEKNGLYCCDIDGKNKQRVLEGSYNLIGMNMNRIFFTNLPLNGKEPKVLRSLMIREDQTFDWRNHSGDSNPDAQYGWPDSVLTIDRQRLITNHDLANDKGAAKIFTSIGVNPNKIDIKVKRDSDKILIVDPADLGDLYSGSTVNAVKLRDESVLLRDFGGLIKGPLLKTPKGDLKILQVWDKVDANGQPVFTNELSPQVKAYTVSQNGLGGKHEGLIFLNYDNYWFGYLSACLQTCPHQLVSVLPGTYTIGYEQWDPTLQYPLNVNRRNLVAICTSLATD